MRLGRAINQIDALREALLADGVQILEFAPVPRAIAVAVAEVGADIADDGRLDMALAGVFADMTGTSQRSADN